VSHLSADCYDAIYAFKDYAKEAAQIDRLIRRRCPNARTALDVGCGTGEHARHLNANHRREVDGIDVDEAALELARGKSEGRSFVTADMADFDLRRRFDAVLCLFGSIGYLESLDRVTSALHCFRRHLSPGGVVVLEPFLTRDEFKANQVVVQHGTTVRGSIERVCRTEVTGALARLHFEYRIEEAAGIQRFSETHELGLFSRDEIQSAFSSAGLNAVFEEGGLTGRGLWLAEVAI
jgi:ubiquinone/menaquinone biosynthesis C-methylase UbiE